MGCDERAESRSAESRSAESPSAESRRGCRHGLEGLEGLEFCRFDGRWFDSCLRNACDRRLTPVADPRGRVVDPEAAGGYGTRGADSLAATVTAYLVGGPAVYGFLGWLADRWLGTAFLLPVGVVGGMALSLYIVWLRYGKP